MENEKKKRGRPPLSPEEKEQRRLENNRKKCERDRANGYASQKKYRATHPEKYNCYEPKVRIPIEKREELARLSAETGLSITQLFVVSIREKYGVDLSKSK